MNPVGGDGDESAIRRRDDFVDRRGRRGVAEDEVDHAILRDERIVAGVPVQGVGLLAEKVGIVGEETVVAAAAAQLIATVGGVERVARCAAEEAVVAEVAIEPITSAVAGK